MSKESCCSSLKQLFLRCDFFYTTQFLRYRSEPEYRTYTGACCSMIIVVSFISVFTNVFLRTIGKTTITFDMSVIDQSTSPLNVSTSIESSESAMLMFAVGIEKFNLSNPSERYFDIKFKVIQSTNKTKVVEYIDLEPCSFESWNITPNIGQAYNRLNFSNFLCVPNSLQFSLQGKYSDSIFNYVQIQISKCNALLNSSRPCSNDTYILSQLSANNFNANLYFLNSYIHPDREDSVEYYIEDRNYLQFNYNYGGLVNLFVSKYEVTTDFSIWPIDDKEVAKGGYIDKIGQYRGYQHDGQTLDQFFIRRESNTVLVNKQYTKLDDTLSYIGGLFGFIMSVLIFLQKYTQSCYQIDAGGTLYQHDNQTAIDNDNFNLLWYLGYLCYSFLRMLGVSVEWSRMQIYDRCREEIQKQFDVCFLFERITFLERTVKLLFSDEQYKMLYLQHKPTLQQAGELRSNFESPSKIKQHSDSHQNTDSLLNNHPNSCSVIDVNLSHQEDVSQVESKQSARSVKGLRKGLSVLKKESLRGDEVSRKIIFNLDRQIAAKIEECLGESHSQEENLQGKRLPVQVRRDTLDMIMSESSNVIQVKAIDMQSSISEVE